MRKGFSLVACVLLMLPVFALGEAEKPSLEELLIQRAEIDKAIAQTKEEEIVTGAIEKLKTYWHDEIYAESAGMDLDGFLEIKWTRVVYVKSDIPDGMHTQPFKDMNCFIEFILLSDYYGSHPYYSHAGIAECVAFKKDGSYEVLRMNPLETYRSRTFSADFSPIISSVSDRGSDFNQIFFLAR